MKALLFVTSIAFAGCGGVVCSIPSSALPASSVTLDGPFVQSLAMTHSADELRAALAGRWAQERLDAFLAETSFATTDVALVRAGDDRGRLVGQTTKGDLVTLYFTNTCSPCAGGNPGSYYDAHAAYQASRVVHTELVRVPKGARVEVRVCPTTCGRCPTNVP